MNTNPITAPSDAEVWTGAEMIARHTGLRLRRVYDLHERGLLPTFKLGGVVAMRPAAWRAHCERLEREAMAG